MENINKEKFLESNGKFEVEAYNNRKFRKLQELSSGSKLRLPVAITQVETSENLGHTGWASTVASGTSRFGESEESI